MMMMLMLKVKIKLTKFYLIRQLLLLLLPTNITIIINEYIIIIINGYVLYYFYKLSFFYLPHYLWKSVEGGLMRNIIIGLDKPIAKPPDDDQQVSLKLLTNYLYRSFGHKHKHRKLFYTHLIRY